jgi:uncharacterized membrane protein
MLKSAKIIKSYPATLAVGLVITVGALVRLHNLGIDSLWLDEAISWSQSKDSLVDVIRRTASDNYYPPLHNLFLFAVIKFFGDGEWSLRLPSAIFGVAGIAALYWLGTMTVGRTAGLLGAVMLAFSPFHFKYSQEARMYSLLALTATLYAATCFYYLRAPSLGRGALVSVAGLALVYSHPYGVLDWIAIAVAFAAFAFSPMSLSRRRAVLVWAASNIIIAVGFAPWALILADRAKSILTNGFWIPAPTPEFTLKMLEDLTGGGLFLGVVLAGVVLSVVGRLRTDVMVLCSWIVAPIAFALVISIVSTPILYPRYVIGSLPPLFLLSSFGYTKYAKNWQGAILFMLVAVVVAGLAFWGDDPYRNTKNDWRSVASFLSERMRENDCVLSIPGYFALPLSYYRRNSPCQWAPNKVADLPSKINASVLFTILTVHDTFAAALQAPILNELRRRGWNELDRTEFRGLQVVTLRRQDDKTSPEE